MAVPTRIHHRLMHTVLNKTENEEKQNVLKTTNGNDVVRHHRSEEGTTKVLLRVIPVTVYGSSKIVLTYALLHEASTVTLID